MENVEFVATDLIIPYVNDVEQFAMTYHEAGLSNTDVSDREEIADDLIQVHEDKYDNIVVSFEEKGEAFRSNFSCMADWDDLEELGWDFTHVYDEVVKAKGVSIENAEVYEKENYSPYIYVSDIGSSYIEYHHEGGKENTGDDKKTYKDLEILYHKGKLSDIDKEYWDQESEYDKKL